MFKEELFEGELFEQELFKGELFEEEFSEGPSGPTFVLLLLLLLLLLVVLMDDDMDEELLIELSLNGDGGIMDNEDEVKCDWLLCVMCASSGECVELVESRFCNACG